MLELLVFRHAKAKRESGTADHDRTLTERGRRNAQTMGQWLAAERLVPDAALISDSARTRQTFELARAAFPTRLRVVDDPDLYLASEGALLEAVHHAPAGTRRLLMCGHNPGLHDFTTALIRSGDPAALDLLQAGFSTAAVALLSLEVGGWREVRWRSAHLLRFVTPASLSDAADEDD